MIIKIFKSSEGMARSGFCGELEGEIDPQTSPPKQASWSGKTTNLGLDAEVAPVDDACGRLGPGHGIFEHGNIGARLDCCRRPCPSAHRHIDIRRPPSYVNGLQGDDRGRWNPCSQIN